MTRLMAVIIALGMMLPSQTLVDVQRQGKGTEFLQAPFLKPVRVGGTLPSTCETGELYFLTAAPAGGNLYVCHAVGEWASQGSAGQGAVTIENDGEVVGVRPTVNFVPGFGIVQVVTDSGSHVEVAHSVDTALLMTKGFQQSGTGLRCNSSAVEPNQHECSLTPTLGEYTPGMVIRWNPGEDIAAGSATLAIDDLEVVPVKLADGVTDPREGDFLSANLYQMWYDGTSFRSFPVQIPSQYATVGSQQGGAAHYCASAGGVATAYTCGLSPALESYTTGMVVRWIPDIDNADGPVTLNIDGLGPAALRHSDGFSDLAAGTISGGSMYTIWYDGAQFRLLGSVALGFATVANIQGGTAILCEATEGTVGAFNCAINPPLSSYSRGMVLRIVPHSTSNGGATTLEVGSLGAVSVKRADGVNDLLPGDLRSGQLHTLWYDGTHFRLVSSLAETDGLFSRPACTEDLRGHTWFVRGTAGVGDELAICAKDEVDQLGWRMLN